MKKVTTYLVFILIVGLLLFLYGFSSNRNSHKKIRKVAIEFYGNDVHFLTHDMVNKLLIQNEVKVNNQRKSILDLHLLEKGVSSNPYVEKATVFLTIDGLLKTTVKQRKPIARIVTNKESYYVDRSGVKMPVSQNYSARVPLVLGVNSVKGIAEITEIVNTIAKDDFLTTEIVGIRKNRNEEYVFNVRSGDHVIYFGKFENVPVKLKKIKAFYNKAFTDKSIEKYQKINVTYHNQVVCTKIDDHEK